MIQNFINDVRTAIATSNTRKGNSASVDVRWSFPPMGWVKLNTDGTSKGLGR